MNKDFLSYEQALELEQIGFNEPCYAVYSEFDQTRIYDIDSIKEGKVIPALLYQQAFRFFREKYGYYPLIEFNVEHKKWISAYYNINGTMGSVSVENTYEQAELACIKKLIEIIKKEKL